MSSKKSVSVIKASCTISGQPINNENKIKVCAYARVSTEKDEQLNSLETQCSFYTSYISSNPEWELVNIYFDEGISGLNTKYRAGFNQMITDAIAGKIDLILTKSISRFARNTVDTLTTIRTLKNLGIAVYFEKENINTLDSKGEFVLTLMSSFAQEESKSISENVKWAIRKNFAEGKFAMPYSCFLGYKRGTEKFEMVIDKEQAKVVRMIYRLFFEGNSVKQIAKHLGNEKIPSPSGKDKWRGSSVISILRNEKYCGDALLQKKYVYDIFSKKSKKNKGELDQYFIKNSHPGIIKHETYEEAQLRLKTKYKTYNSKYLFSGLIQCDLCKRYYRANFLYYKCYKEPVFKWECSGKYHKVIRCKNIILYDEQLHSIMSFVFDTIIEKYKSVFEDINIILEKLIKNKRRLNSLKKKVLKNNLKYSKIEHKVFFRIIIYKIEIKENSVMIIHLIDNSSIEYEVKKWSYSKHKAKLE